MKVEYVGPHDEVEIAETGAVCRRGQCVEVDADLGKRLTEQRANWQAVKPPVKATTKKES